MNILENIHKNPTVLYGIAGLFAGNLLGGSQKERTSQAVLYGALGAAIGWFVTKGNEQKARAQVSTVVAIESAETAAKAADAAAAATDGFGLVHFGRAGRPARGTRAYRRARRMLYQQHGGQSPSQAQAQSYSNGYDDGGDNAMSMLSGAGVGML
jgi:hypothetical protein